MRNLSTTYNSIRKRETLPHRFFFSWNHFFSNIFSKTVAFTKFLSKHTLLWLIPWKIFRENKLNLWILDLTEFSIKNIICCIHSLGNFFSKLIRGSSIHYEISRVVDFTKFLAKIDLWKCLGSRLPQNFIRHVSFLDIIWHYQNLLAISKMYKSTKLR